MDLPLHGGTAPYWLVKRMKGLAHAIFETIIDEYGVDGAIEKLADSLWFQSLSCALAYDWHSSGTTTVVCGVLNSKGTVKVEDARSQELIYRLPKRVNWDALRVAYDEQPDNYEQFLCIRGVGPATVRALALISDLIYGEKPSWRDPVKFSFAFGGKDGVPYPVGKHTMDETTEILSNAVKEAKARIKNIC